MAAGGVARPTSEERSATTKRERTRQLVLEAALDCISEEGVVGATAAKIAKRCDLSWGVIQYHFGDRSGLLLALIEWAFGQLEASLSRLGASPGTAEERIGALVDGYWVLITQPRYKAMLEVQLQLGCDPSSVPLVRHMARQMRSHLRKAWRSALRDFPTPLVDRAERLATTSLRGLALEHAFEGKRSIHAKDRRVLVATLLSLVRGKSI